MKTISYYISLFIRWFLFQNATFENVVKDLDEKNFYISGNFNHAHDLVHKDQTYKICGLNHLKPSFLSIKDLNTNSIGIDSEYIPLIYRVIIFIKAKKLYTELFFDKVEKDLTNKE